MSGEEEGTLCTVSFSPDGVAVEMVRGTTILEACRAAGIAIDAVCGGTGKCGRCKVRPKGLFDPGDTSALAEEERESGVVLACETLVTGDLEVEVLPRSRIREHQILTRTLETPVVKLSPWVRKVLLELPKATLYDNTADFERVLRALGDRNLEMPIVTLRNMSNVLREGGWTVTATVADLKSRGEITRLEPGDKCGCLLGVAIDIGTTTVVGQLIDLLTGDVLASASEYNRQISKGEDVIARMMYGEENGVGELTDLARETVNSVIGRLLEDTSKERECPVTAVDVVGAAIAGNTIMTHFFVGVDTRFIRLEPYVPVAHHMPPRSGHDLGMEAHPSSDVLLFPSRAGYLGGDVVADVLASGIHRSDDLAMLIDVGTNGEIVLGCREWLVSCACSAGPAFEGGEVSSGMRAMHGAIDSIRVNHDFATSYHVIGDERPNGICGSGLIDLIAEMYENGVIDRKARIQRLQTDRVREGEEGLEYVVEFQGSLGEGATGDLVITDADLQNVLRTKAAIFGAATVLLRKMSEDLDGIDTFVIAGGFGNHLDIDRAVSIGMFPDIPRDKYRFIGNGALEGARLALLSEEMRKDMVEIFDQMTYIELSVDNDFYDEFTSSMFIPHTDLAKFPSFKDRGSQETAR
ncbi:MAG: DUF4445 domain-containing protein [Methanobacteriota archaeon]|nr:MAG: DUF4445 domain-containing protein [Euryarchaeota archaeon]